MPTLLRRVLLHASQDLTTAGARFAVVGGLAVAVRSVLRTTQDVDFAVAVASDAQAEAIAAVMIRYGYRPYAEIDHATSDRLATLRLISPHLPQDIFPDESPLVDLLFHNCGIESETVEAAQPTEVLEGLSLPTARIPHLIAMKLISESEDRLQDRIDLKHLIKSSTPADLAEARALIGLIIHRGLHQNKDLHAILQSFIPQP